MCIRDSDDLILLKEKGVRLSVATACAPELYIPALRRLGVYELFDAFASLHEVPHGKSAVSYTHLHHNIVEVLDIFNHAAHLFRVAWVVRLDVYKRQGQD